MIVERQEALEQEVLRTSQKLDKIVWMLALVCAEVGVLGVGGII